MFLSNEDFYTLRRITLSDLLDAQSCFRVTNKVMSTAKREFLKLINPDFSQKRENKKRLKLEQDENEPESIIDVFQHEDQICDLYEN